jgi:putative ABC transport system permease protein
MNLLEATKYSVDSLVRRSLRSWLTILGMVIGVMAVVVILSVSEGFNREINTQMSSFGADMMFVYPVADLASSFSGGSAGLMTTSGKLRQADADDVKSIPGVKEVARSLYGRASMSFKGKNITGFIVGVDDTMFDMYPTYIEIESGRAFRDGERNVAFFANDAANKLFGKDKIEVGSVVMMNNRNYRVVGVQKRIGTSLSSADDSQIYVTFEDAKDMFKGQFLEDEVGVIFVQVDDGYSADEIKDAIERKIAANHRLRVEDKDFSVITSSQITEIVGTILLSIQLVLAAVTLIASVVGAIGIANTMFMNVLERIREIGILKSVGATRSDILMLFLIESAIIGLAGGIIGLACGYLILEILTTYFGVPVFLRLRIIAFVFIFSIGTGVLAGLIPSWRAAKMDPVEALAYD